VWIDRACAQVRDLDSYAALAATEWPRITAHSVREACPEARPWTFRSPSTTRISKGSSLT